MSEYGYQQIHKVQRKSNFEMLRIIAMIMILFFHFARHGGFQYENTDLSFPRFWHNFIMMDGKTGNNIFILISGYFLITNKSCTVNWERVLKLWGQVFFYSIMIHLISFVLESNGFNVVALIKAIVLGTFPITFNTWWFASTYFVLYILHPYLNAFIYSLEKNTFQKYLLITLFFWCIVPTVTGLSYQSNNLLWFITLYCVAAYVRLYGDSFCANKKIYLWGWLISTLVRYLLSCTLTVLGTNFLFAANNIRHFNSQQSVFTFLSAFFLFMFFEKLEIGYCKWINKIASATFGVYLLHDSAYIRSLLWEEIFTNTAIQNSGFIIVYSFVVVSLIFAVCTFLELLRQATFGKIFSTAMYCCMEAWKEGKEYRYAKNI